VKLAVNAATNKIYLANFYDVNCSCCCNAPNITVIDGATNSTTLYFEDLWIDPEDLVVNPVTNKIYVSIFGGNNFPDTILVIDGATNSITSWVTDPNASPGPARLAVNSVTNKIYVANSGGGGSGNVTVIDGVTNVIATVTDPNARGPSFVAVNPASNKIYVANSNSGNVTVIDGATNSITTVPTGANPNVVAVNSVTNKIYVTNSSSGTVTVIDGATNSTTTVRDPNADAPNQAVVNPLTNKIYVTNSESNNVTVIDGARNSTATVRDPNAIQPNGVAVDSVTNTIYVANSRSNNVTVIDGATNSTSTVTSATDPVQVDLNPATNRIYVLNIDVPPLWLGVDTSYVTVIAGAGTGPGLAPSSLSFGPQGVGTFSPAQQATLRNTSSAPLKIPSIGRSGDFYEGNNCPTTLAPNATCTVSVRFTPTSPGAKSAAVTIWDNSPGGPHKLPLSGTGSGTVRIMLTLSPSALSFGSVAVGTTSTPQTVTLTNKGTVAASFLDPFGFATSGTNWRDFEKNPHCGARLAAGKSCTVTVTFKPTASGPRSGLFVVRQGAASVQIALSGTGI
jgi:YVTN family beta-propeller protein